MAGFLRRLRRRSDEPEERPETESAERPIASSAKEEHGPTEEGASTQPTENLPEAPEGSRASSEAAGPTPAPADGAAHPPSPTTAPVVEPEGPSPPEAPSVESGPPPPLPPADLDAVRAATPPRNESGRCFLCGTEMVGSYCPTCRLNWNE